MRFLLLFGFSFLSLTLSAQLLVPGADSIYLRTNYIKREVYITARDGVRLFTAIYQPKDTSQKYPFILVRTPYSCAPYGEDAVPSFFHSPFLLRAGYIFVFQDVRGRYMSEGDFVDVRPALAREAGQPLDTSGIDEGTDTYDTADWLVKNIANNNGRMGVWGISYPGFYATCALLANHPAIRAVSPQAPVTDWFIGDDVHHNGAFFLMDEFSFNSGFGKKRYRPTTKSESGFNDWKTPDNYDFYLKAGALPNFSRRFGMDTIAFWNDAMNHPNYDDFWKARNIRQHLTALKPAVLTVGGLFDAEDLWGTWNTYKSIEKQNPRSFSNRIVMGPWAHGGWKRSAGDKLGRVRFNQPTSEYFQKSIELPFFEYYLKDKGVLELPEATIFETGSNRWTSYSTWPPERAQRYTYFLQPGGGMELRKAATASAVNGLGFDEYVSDPNKPVPYTEDIHLYRTRTYMIDDQRFAARRPDVVVYQTPVLTQPITVTGPVTADLWVSTSGTDADWVVKLIDVFPDTLKEVENGVPMGGYQMLVRGEIMRGRYRNSYENPEAFQPNKPTKVKFELPDVAHTFLPGHKLMIQIQSSWFPLVDRNPQQFIDIYKAEDKDFRKATHRIWHSQQYPSAIWLPVLNREKP